MGNIGKIVLWVVGIVAALMLISYGFGWFDVFYTKTIGKEKEDARREVFEQTQSYVEGMRQEALNLRQQYVTEKDSVAKAALKFTAQQRFANFDEEKAYKEDKISVEIRDFINEMKYK